MCMEKTRGDGEVGEKCGVVLYDAKRVLVGAGARVLFYPTLLYNVTRNKVQSEFRWWDRVNQFLLLGAVPFPADVPRLKQIGVGGVVTLNEPYETLVPTTLYRAHNIKHLVIPTRDYLFAPSFDDILKAVDFIHSNECCGKMTYVHCKAGRRCSTTIVLCYLVQHKQMNPDAAYEYVRSIRPRVLLAASQRKAVEDYYSIMVKKSISSAVETRSPGALSKTLSLPSTAVDASPFDDSSIVMVTDSDLDGYNSFQDPYSSGNKKLADVSLACKVQFASQAAITRLSNIWLRNLPGQRISRKKISHSVGVDQICNSIGVDIQVH